MSLRCALIEYLVSQPNDGMARENGVSGASLVVDGCRPERLERDDAVAVATPSTAPGRRPSATRRRIQSEAWSNRGMRCSY